MIITAGVMIAHAGPMMEPLYRLLRSRRTIERTRPRCSPRSAAAGRQRGIFGVESLFKFIGMGMGSGEWGVGNRECLSIFPIPYSPLPIPHLRNGFCRAFRLRRGLFDKERVRAGIG